MYVHTIVVFCMAMTLQVLKADASSPGDLMKHILNQYPEAYRYARPVSNHSETVNVRFGLALIRIRNIDKKTHVGNFQLWIRYTWHDSHLTWDPSAFGGQTTIHIPGYKIWRPDIRLYNGADDDVSYSWTNAVVFNNGDVLWIPPATARVQCYEDGFNEYTCSFKFGSWTYDGFLLDLDFYDGLEEVDMSDYIVNYDVVANSARKNVKFYSCCKEPYPDLTFRLKIHL